MMLPLLSAPWSSIVLLVALCLLTTYWWRCVRRPPGLPPGPRFPLPLVGHQYLLHSDPRTTYQQWRQTYGDVFSFYMGRQLLVVLNGAQVIREALVKQGEAFAHRPDLYVFNVIDEGQGIFGNSGASWKEQRKTTVEILREMGVGKNLLCEKILEEITHFMQAIREHKQVVAATHEVALYFGTARCARCLHAPVKQGQPMDLQRLTQCSVSNNICSIIFGHRLPYSDPFFVQQLEIADEFFASTGASAFVNFLPWLNYLPGDPFGGKRLWQRVRRIEDDFLVPEIKAHLQSYSGSLEKDDFMYRYIDRMTKQQQLAKETTLSEFNLKKCSLNLFVGGSDTTTTVLSWALLYFLHFPQVQEKCFQEVRAVVGTDRLPSMRDRAQMTYVEATIAETLRFSGMLPGVYHMTSRDVTVRGCVIPRGTIVFPNQHSTTHDPDVWGDPEHFRPERFLGPDGKLARTDEIVVFGMGRRVCLGEALARMEMFLYLASLVQNFRFLPPSEGTLPPLEGRLGLSCCSRPHNIRAVLRRECEDQL